MENFFNPEISTYAKVLKDAGYDNLHDFQEELIYQFLKITEDNTLDYREAIRSLAYRHDIGTMKFKRFLLKECK